MSKRKLSKVLKGGLPAQESSAPGAPADSRLLGYGEPFTPEVINRGVYAVAQEVDKVFSEFLKLQRKAVTRGVSKTITTLTSDFILPVDARSDNSSAYAGLSESTTPKTLIEFFQSEGNSLSVQARSGYTVYAQTLTPFSDNVDFQLVSLPGVSASIIFDFDITGTLSVSYGVGTGTGGEDVLTVTAAATDTWADIAAAINADGIASSNVVAYGSSNIVHADHPASSIAGGAHLTSSAQVDADVVGVFINDPVTASKFTNSMGDAIVTYDSVSETFTLKTDVVHPVGSGLTVGDYVIIIANNPTSSASEPVSRVEVKKVASVSSDPLSLSGGTFTVEGTFGLITELGVADNEAEFYLHAVPSGHWAIGHSHHFDPQSTAGSNPSPSSFSSTFAQDNVRWFQNIGGIPNSDFSSGRDDITRVANLKYLMGAADGSDPVENFSNDDINAELASLPLYDGSANRPSILVSPRFGGTAPIDLEDLRIVVSNPDASFLASQATVLEYDDALGFINPVSVGLEVLETSGSEYLLRLNPFEDNLHSGTSKHYKVVLNVGGADSGTGSLSSVYFSGTNGASPIIRSGVERGITGVEIWFVHKPSDGLSPLPNLTLDVYSSSTGEKGSYVKIGESIPLDLSHVVHRGPVDNRSVGVFDKIVAYRATPFPEGYTVGVGEHLLFSINQNVPSADLRRVISAQLVESHQSQTPGHVGSFIGHALAGGRQNVPVTEIVPAAVSSTGMISANVFEDSLASFVADGVSAGDYLVIEDGPNAGVHKITSVSATQLTLETSTYSGAGATGTIYRVVSGVGVQTPLGAEGGVSDYFLVSNVGFEVGDVTISYGEFSRISDIPPDGLRVSASSTGDTGFLTSKISEIMGESITNTVPPDRTLIGLSNRIDSLQQVSIGLGIGGSSFGRINVNAYPSINDAFSAAFSLLPTGGTVVLKSGVYGDGSVSASNVWTGPLVLPAGIRVVAEQKLSSTLYGADVYLQENDTALSGFRLESNSYIRVSPAGSPNAVDNVLISSISMDSTSSIILGDSSGWQMTKAIQRLRIEDIEGGSIGSPISYSDFDSINTDPEASLTSNITFRDVSCNSVTLGHLNDVELFNVNTTTLESLWCNYVRSVGGAVDRVITRRGHNVVFQGLKLSVQFLVSDQSQRVALLNSQISVSDPSPSLSDSYIVDVYDSSSIVVFGNTVTAVPTTSEYYTFSAFTSTDDIVISSNLVTSDNFSYISSGVNVSLSDNQFTYRDGNSPALNPAIFLSGCSYASISGLNVYYGGSLNPYPFGRIIDCLSCDQVLVSNVNSEVTSSALSLRSCDTVSLNNAYLAGGNIDYSTSSNVQIVSYQTGVKSYSVFVPSPASPGTRAGFYFEAQTSTSVADGDELIKIGTSPSTRLWSVNGSTVLTTNVSSFDYDGSTFTNIVREMVGHEGKLQVLSGDSAEIIHKLLSDGTDKQAFKLEEYNTSYGTTLASAARFAKMTMGDNDLFNVYTDFNNAIAFTYNLSWEPPTPATGYFDGAYWRVVDDSKRAGAFIMDADGEFATYGILAGQESSSGTFLITKYQGVRQERGSIYVFDPEGWNSGGVKAPFIRIVNNKIVAEANDFSSATSPWSGSDNPLFLGGTRSPVHITMSKRGPFSKPSGFYLASGPVNGHGTYKSDDSGGYDYSGIIFYDNGDGSTNADPTRMVIGATKSDGSPTSDLVRCDITDPNRPWGMIPDEDSSLIFTVSKNIPSFPSSSAVVYSGYTKDQATLLGVHTVSYYNAFATAVQVTTSGYYTENGGHQNEWRARVDLIGLSSSSIGLNVVFVFLRKL